MQQSTIIFHTPISNGKLYYLNNQKYYPGDFDDFNKVFSSIEHQSAETSPWNCRIATKSRKKIEDIKETKMFQLETKNH